MKQKKTNILFKKSFDKNLLITADIFKAVMQNISGILFPNLIQIKVKILKRKFLVID